MYFNGVDGCSKKIHTYPRGEAMRMYIVVSVYIVENTSAVEKLPIFCSSCFPLPPPPGTPNSPPERGVRRLSRRDIYVIITTFRGKRARAQIEENTKPPRAVRKHDHHLHFIFFRFTFKTRSNVT